MYYNSEHYKAVLAAMSENPPVKRRRAGTNFASRTRTKNMIILRHVYERFREQFGPYDALRGGVNYHLQGRPHKLKYGKAGTYDVFVLKAQIELLEVGLIEPNEILSPASVGMCTGWVLTSQPLNQLWKVDRVACFRKSAIDANWLLFTDVVTLEKLNYATLTDYETTVEEEPEKISNVDEIIDVTPD